MELLSPAGNWESLTAAVQNGADAVYFGGGDFNARRFAGNFSGDELKKAVDYCHLRGVHAYITLNTLILDKEMQPALDFAAELYRAGADAVLVQDLGLMAILRKQLPALTLHASTQMAIHDAQGVTFAAEHGLTRAVLARELSLAQIKDIAKHSTIELEAFVHGALCMCASGNCLFSSMVGERSGNRGTCAQPCRKRISTQGEPGEADYALSLSDLCMLGHVNELEAAGVCCLKIEGRMKRPEYVAAATRAYRAAIDGADAKTLREYGAELLAVFNRGGERTGYFYGDDAHTGCIAQNTHDEKLLSSLRASYARENRRRPVKLHLTAKQNEALRLCMEGGGVSVSIEKEPPSKAEKEQSAKRFSEQLQKLGDTPFYAEGCTVDTDSASFVSVGTLNALRRETCAAFEECFCAPRICPAPCAPELPRRNKHGAPRIRATVRSIAQLQAAFSAGADEIFFEPWNYAALDTALLDKYAGKLMLSLPAIIRTDGERKIIARLLESGIFCGAEANNIGQLSLLKGLAVRAAGLHCNAVNRYTVKMLKEEGCTDVTLSPELSKAQLRDILAYEAAVLPVYGRVPLMQLRHCPKKEYAPCARCEGDAGFMTDEAGRQFPLSNIKQEDGCLVRLLNCETLDVIDLANALTGASAWLLSFFDEDAEETAERVKAARAAIEGKEVCAKGTTRGHWNRPLQ